MDNPPAAPLISIIMMNRPPLSNRKLLFTGAALFALLNTLPALEPRLWISLDGRTIDAELIKTDGDIVELKDKEGRVLKVPKSSLSFGDLDYIAEYGPEEKKSSLGSKPAGKAKVPNPAKEMKFSPKSVKKDAGEIKLGTLSFQVTETPRFKILTSKGVDPMDTAELAERLWHDMAFFHASFAGKFKDRRMAIILADADKVGSRNVIVGSVLSVAGVAGVIISAVLWPKAPAKISIGPLHGGGAIAVQIPL